MNEISQKVTNRGLNWLTMIGVIILATPIFYCVFYPLLTVNLTGQVCGGFSSGHVPPQAEERYFELIFTAAQEENYEWLETVLRSGMALKIQALQSHISLDYQTILADHLGLRYERILQFEDGTRVRVVFSGRFDCPDFDITDEEIFKNIELFQFDLITE